MQIYLNLGGVYKEIMNTFNREQKKRILNVLKKCVSLTDEMSVYENWEEPLTGPYFKLTAIDLVYFLFEIETEFGVRIPHSMLKEYGFSTLGKICAIIQVQLSAI